MVLSLSEMPDEDELRYAATKPEYKPESTNPASELGLMVCDGLLITITTEQIIGSMYSSE